jgi:medium-chain acyl-[acyl-carrier-protein] hydrolase
MTQKINVGSRQLGARIRLFCLPYAGGSAAIYKDWQKAVPAELQICPIELPGRGLRSREPLPHSIPELAREIASALDLHNDKPLALFGHSMGAAIAYEVARNLEAKNNRALCVLIVSGARAPFLERKKPGVGDLSDSEFLDHIRDLNGTPPEVLADQELMAVLLPMLRRDFINCERYRLENPHVLRTPITALAGDGDVDISISDVEAWSALTVGRFLAQSFPGDHFFIKSEEVAVIAAVTSILLGPSAKSDGSMSRISGAVEATTGRIAVRDDLPLI